MEPAEGIKQICHSKHDEEVADVYSVSQWFEDKFQEVENEEQQLRKLHVVVDSLVIHRKGELHLLFTDLSFSLHRLSN